MRRIQILKTGDAISDNGTPYNFSSNALHEIADTYNPDNFKAPVIVSYPAHNTQGIADSELYHNKQLAFGAPDYLEVVGDKLFAVFTELTKPINQVFDWIKDRQILGFSASIYPPGSPVNPYKGKHALRHIASCGVNPPAIKGMGVDFTESIEALSFSVSPDEGALNFQSPVDFGMGNHHLMSIMRSLRDKLIELYGLPQTETLLPPTMLDEMAMGGDCSCDMSEFREQLAQLQPIQPTAPIELKEDSMKENKGKDYDEKMKDDEEEEDTKEMDMSEANAEIAQLKAALAESKAAAAAARQDLRRNEIASFTEGLEREGKLLPAQKQAIAVSFSEGDKDVSLDDHLLSLNEAQFGFMKSFLQGMPNLVNFGEFATDGDGPTKDEMSRDDLNNQVLKYAEQHSLGYSEAFTAVTRQLQAA